MPRYAHACVALGFCLAFAVETQAAGAKPSFVSDGTLKICTSGGFPPMEYYAKPGDTQLIGFEVDTLNALAAHWGVKTEFMVGDFKGHLPSLEAKRCDVVASGISVTAERLKKYDAVPYFSTAVVLLIAENDSTTKKPEDLSGKRVAIEAGTNYETIMADLNKTLTAAGKAPAEVQTYPSAAAVIEQVLVGRATATITQDTAAAYRIMQMPGKMKVSYTYPADDFYGIYLRKNGADVDHLRAGLEHLQSSGQFKTLLEKWRLPADAIKIGKAGQ